MLRSGGDSLKVKRNKFLGVLVSWFLVKVSNIQSFKVPMLPYYPNDISCFLEDIDPIFKKIKKFKTASQDFPAPPFPQLSFCGFPFLKVRERIFPEKDL